MIDAASTPTVNLFSRMPAREWLLVTGADAVSFLDGLITQDVASIPPGGCALGMFLTAKARIIAPAWVHRLAADSVLLELLPSHASVLMAHLRRYRLRARIEITERTLSSCIYMGPDLAVTAASAVMISTRSDGSGVVVIGDDEDVASMIDDHEQTPWNTVEVARIDRGCPDLVDLVVDAMPAEVGADDLGVSYTKGCYLGQEPVARLHWRGRANRTLRRLTLSDTPHDANDACALTPHGDSMKSAGHVSSWATGPDEVVRALGSIRREIPAGATIKFDQMPLTATVLDPPDDTSGTDQ